VPEVVLGVGLLTFFVLCSVPLGLMTLIVAHTVLGLGFAVPLINGRFAELDIRLVEASLDLGATVHQTFFSIIVPLLRPTIIAAGLLVFIISFDDFVLSYFCSGTSVQTLSLYLLSMLRTGISPTMNALSTLLLLLSSILVFVFCWTTFSSKAQE
jgi:spermidine/putrescine transport system permease protein